MISAKERTEGEGLVGGKVYGRVRVSDRLRVNNRVRVSGRTRISKSEGCLQQTSWDMPS